MSDELKHKLAQVEDDLRGLKEDKATAVKERESAKEEYAAVPDGEDDAEQFEAAKEKVRYVGEIEEKINVATAKQVDLLKMVGGKEREMRDAGGNGGPVGRGTPTPESLQQLGWDSSFALADQGVRDQLEFIASSSGRFGGLEIGMVAPREVLVADIADGLLPKQRRSAEYPLIRAIQRPFSFLDLVPTGTTDGNAVPYTQESPLTGGVLETAEGSAKPELYFDFTEAEAPVRTLAGYMKIRKQALADFSALQSIIDTRLRYLVRKRLESQVLAGDGSGVNLRGILNTSGIGTVAYNANVPVSELILSGITNIYLNDGSADGIVMHPRDWQTALTEKAHFGGGTGAAGTAGSYEYIGGGPFGTTPSTLWGVALTPSQAMTQGFSLVGDFSVGTTLLIREGVKVLMSDSDQDDFIKNRVTMLAEMRAALLVWRPSVFQNVDVAA